jgi:hypothetical protein
MIPLDIRAYAAARRYSAATTERWLRIDPRDGEALLEVASELRLGENQLRGLWEWAEEIALRDGLAVAQVLRHEAILAARARPVSRNDRLRLVKAALRRLRFPQLVATEDRLAALIGALGLPRSVRMTLPDHLEGDEVRVEIVAQDPAALRAAALALQAAADRPGCAEIFRLLGGESRDDW